jgi:hypothetical protein
MKGLSLCSGNTVYLNLPTPSKEGNNRQNGNGNFAVLVNLFDLYIFHKIIAVADHNYAFYKIYLRVMPKR